MHMEISLTSKMSNFMVTDISLRSDHVRKICQSSNPQFCNTFLALPETANYTSDDEIKNLRGECEAEAPTKHLYEFYGNIEVKDNSHSMRDDGQRIPVDAAQVKFHIRKLKFLVIFLRMCTVEYFCIAACNLDRAKLS